MRFPILLAALGLTLAGCQQKEGCTDPVAANYDAEAIEDDGSCAYAGCTNSDAWNFDAAATIDDGSCELPSLDGYTYKTVQIGDQAWFAENLRTTVYANGDPIPANLSQEEMEFADEGFTTVYGTDNGWDCYHSSPDFDACDEVQSLAAYGRLYNFFAVEDERGLCPVGWHVPDTAEWSALKVHLSSVGFAGREGTALKSTSGWQNQTDGSSGNGSDDFGFAALPGGHFIVGYGAPGEGIYNAGQLGHWWTSVSAGATEGGVGLDVSMTLNSPLLSVPSWLQCTQMDAFSVRCVRDGE